ncbi:MAG: PEP-CTERM sorting domain-containing protein [Acidobacteria bacterium]|nr:PEP-CTERM sorting domain-containing protein [Acidobacteriota bacterium]
MYISLDANAQGASGLGQPLTINALNTLRLPRTGPVFNLPDGYSVDVPDLFVFNNRYVDPNGGGGGEVPEPATCALVGGGLLLAAIWRRRR